MDISATARLYAENNGPISTKEQMTKDEKALKEACQGFEAIFIQSMLKGMRATLPGDGLFPESNGKDIYTSMHDQYLAESISKGDNSVGIGEYLYRQLQDAL